MSQHRERRHVAVVGSGVTGLTAAHILQRAGADVTLFEADDRLGGHAHTHEVTDGSGATLPVDSGFIVHNTCTYPNLLRLFEELGVASRPTEMSLSVRCDECGLEYAGARGLRALFPRGARTDRRYLRMLTEIPRFHRSARALLRSGPASHGHWEPTLGEFVRARRHSSYFTTHFLLPLVSAVWSCPPGTALRYPARHLFTFLAHHGMLTVFGSPQWRTVVGGSRAYVERLAKNLTSVRTSTPVSRLRRTAEGVELRADDTSARFDGAVVATHADQALTLLEDPTLAQREVLGAFGYSRNRVLLHTDPSVLPRRNAVRASWNHRISSCSAPDEAVQVSYHMNRLQGLTSDRDYIVTLNGEGAVPAERVEAAMVYEHPVYTPDALAAQQRLPELSDGVLAFAGAYSGWGFHEDGCRSGAAAAAALGAGW
nr:FAD-dependent oxidoreductase [Allosalinactinospora lopnorensis]